MKSSAPSNKDFSFRNIYVADGDNGRIMRWTRNSTSNGTCIVGCTGLLGSTANQLRTPRDLKFDQDGNLYVVDRDNHRVQKFLIQQSSCVSSKSTGRRIPTIHHHSFLISWMIIKCGSANKSDSNSLFMSMKSVVLWSVLIRDCVWICWVFLIYRLNKYARHPCSCAKECCYEELKMKEG